MNMNRFPQRVIGKPHCRPLLATALLRVLLFVGLSSVAVAALGADLGPTVTLEGAALVQVADDFEHARSDIRYFLRERSSNEHLELKLSPEQAKQIRSGQELRVRGRRSGKMLAADPDKVLAVDADADAVTVLAEPAALAPTSARRVISLIVDITDGSGTRHTVNGRCDGADQLLADEMFGSQTARLNVDGCFGDSSYGAFGFGGQSYPGTAMDVVRVTITEASQSLAGICRYFDWATAADAAAAAQGINLGAYQHRMYVLPEATSGCAWAGLAYVGCADLFTCQAWVRAYAHQPCGYRDAIAHELGHNIGLRHASTDSNNDGISDCEYCDTSDIMGYALGSWRAINAPHKDEMGWLDAARIVDGASGGVFTISALEMQNPPHPQVVKIVEPSGMAHYLSYRAPIGYDAQMGTEYFNRLQVHRSPGSGNSHLITQLADGATHVDQRLNLTVRQLSHTADSATLEVRFDDRRAAYTLSTSSLAFGNQALNLASSAKTITLRSTGGAALPITSIAIGGANPGQFAQTNNCGVSVAAGASCAITVTFKPTSTGAKAATLSVTAGGGAGIKTASLSGRGVRSTFSLSPTALSFGNLARNATSTAKTVRISNTGTVVLPISSIGLVGTNAGQFAQTHNCPARVAVGGNCRVSVVFKPTSTGAKSAVLRVTPGGGAAAKSVSLSGRGI
jgi:Gametolysin peptidase M11